MSSTLPFRSASVPCPRCPAQALTAGPLHHCARCAGIWIDEETLADRVATMKDAPPRALDWSVSEARERLACPLCREAMDAIVVFDVAIDRCPPHGVWFDKDELAHLLERSARPPVIPGTAVAAEVAVGAVEVAAEGASVIGTVAEGLLEVVGAIVSVIDL